MEIKTETKLLLTKREAQDIWGVRTGSHELLQLCPPVTLSRRSYYRRVDVLSAPSKLLKQQMSEINL